MKQKKNEGRKDNKSKTIKIRALTQSYNIISL